MGSCHEKMLTVCSKQSDFLLVCACGAVFIPLSGVVSGSVMCLVYSHALPQAATLFRLPSRYLLYHVPKK